MSEITKHQQQGVSLRAFAEQTGIREGQLLKYVRTGRILGARKHPLTKKWWIYPPAKLLFPDSSATYTRRQHVPQVRAGVAVDVGTRPHGLPAVLPPSVQETLETVAFPLSGRPLLTGVSPGALPGVFAAPGVQEAIRNIKRGAGENHYPVVLSGSQMKLMEQAISDAIDGAIQAMSDEPHGRHEIKPCLDAYNQLYRTLKAAKAAHKTPNEDWRGVEL